MTSTYRGGSSKSPAMDAGPALSSITEGEPWHAAYAGELRSLGDMSVLEVTLPDDARQQAAESVRALRDASVPEQLMSSALMSNWRTG